MMHSSQQPIRLHHPTADQTPTPNSKSDSIPQQPIRLDYQQQLLWRSESSPGPSSHCSCPPFRNQGSDTGKYGHWHLQSHRSLVDWRSAPYLHTRQHGTEKENGTHVYLNARVNLRTEGACDSVPPSYRIQAHRTNKTLFCGAKKVSTTPDSHSGSIVRLCLTITGRYHRYITAIQDCLDSIRTFPHQLKQ